MSFTQVCVVPSLRWRFQNFLNVFSRFPYYLPFKKNQGFAFEQTWIIPHLQRMLCTKFNWNWLSASGEFFFILSMYFCYFVIISPWKRAKSLIWINLNPLQRRMRYLFVFFSFQPRIVHSYGDVTITGEGLIFTNVRHIAERLAVDDIRLSRFCVEH